MRLNIFLIELNFATEVNILSTIKFVNFEIKLKCQNFFL